MRFASLVPISLKALFLSGFVSIFTISQAQSSIDLRVMSANLNGDAQTYQPFAIDIFQGLKPDIVAIQEFNYSNNTDSDMRTMVDTAFGTNFYYYREPYTANGDIPNGIISRYQIVNAGSWADAQQSMPNRGFAWAQIQLPGTNFLYVVSVHLLTSTATARAAEATELQGYIQTNFPANAWIVLAGDFNTGSRTETCMGTFKTFLSDFPIPVDNLGNSDTSVNRNNPHDYVLPSFALTNLGTATVLPSHTFPSGLVFDSRVYTPLSDVAPVQLADSGQAQHMAVMKDFLIPVTGGTTNAPAITGQPQSQTNFVGGTTTFSVTANGSAPLNYQWRFNGTNISSATTNPFTLTNVQLTNAGNYSVVVSNFVGSITSSIAIFGVTNAPPSIATPPQTQTVSPGGTALFSVAASGTPPLSYQWLFNGTNISGAATNPFAIVNVQMANAGNYSVIVSNSSGSVTSSIAILSVASTQTSAVIAQWNFNSSPADGSTATGTTVPSVGNGTASLVAGATATFATGDTTLDPAGSTDNSGWNTATYPTQGTGNKTRGAQFNVSTAGKQGIVVSWSSESPSTGSRYGRMQYSTNSTDFVDYPAAFVNGTSFTSTTNSLAAIPGVNNNANFAFRLVAEFESTAIGTANANYDAGDTAKSYGTAGSMRYDMVTVSGTPLAPPTAAILNVPTLTGNQFNFNVSGTIGGNYIVQTSTNLTTNNWISVQTNLAPFNFTDTNRVGQQKFYRVIAP